MNTRRSFIKKTAGTTLLFGMGASVGLSYTNQWGTNSGGSGGVTWRCTTSENCHHEDSGKAWTDSEAGEYCQGTCSPSNGGAAKTAKMRCTGSSTRPFDPGISWCQWTT